MKRHGHISNISYIYRAYIIHVISSVVKQRNETKAILYDTAFDIRNMATT